MKSDKQSFEQMQRILNLMDEKSNKAMSKYKKENPLCSWDSHCMSAHSRKRQMLYRELCKKLNELSTKFIWHDRGISSTKEFTIYNRLVCRISRQLKMSRAHLRKFSLPELEQMVTGI